jgi:hypothetical protein
MYLTDLMNKQNIIYYFSGERPSGVTRSTGSSGKQQARSISHVPIFDNTREVSFCHNVLSPETRTNLMRYANFVRSITKPQRGKTYRHDVFDTSVWAPIDGSQVFSNHEIQEKAPALHQALQEQISACELLIKNREPGYDRKDWAFVVVFRIEHIAKTCYPTGFHSDVGSHDGANGAYRYSMLTRLDDPEKLEGGTLTVATRSHEQVIAYKENSMLMIENDYKHRGDMVKPKPGFGPQDRVLLMTFASKKSEVNYWRREAVGVDGFRNFTPSSNSATSRFVDPCVII